MNSKSFTYIEGKLYQFINCKLLKNHKIVQEDLWVKNGIIQDPQEIFFDQKIISDIVVDCRSCHVFPGLIDLQINGAFGYDFSYDADKFEDALEKVSHGLLKYGVTSFCPTIISSPPEVYEKVLSQMKDKGKQEGAEVIGLHLEGPFISPKHNGAHPPQNIYAIDSEEGDKIVNLMLANSSKIAIVTLAPELDKGMELVERLVKGGVVVSMGHSAADMGVGERAVKAGACLITHLFNAMLPFHHRDPHLIGLLVSHRRHLHYGVIADGIHTHPAALSLAYSSCPEGMVLVTDAVSALGLEDGIHHLGGRRIEVKGSRAVVAGTDVLCGSLTPLNECVRYLHQNVSHDIVASIEAATLQAARVLGLQEIIGTLAYGSRADVVLMDVDLNPMATFLKGRLAWVREGFEVECLYR